MSSQKIHPNLRLVDGSDAFDLDQTNGRDLSKEQNSAIRARDKKELNFKLTRYFTIQISHA